MTDSIDRDGAMDSTAGAMDSTLLVRPSGHHRWLHRLAEGCSGVWSTHGLYSIELQALGQGSVA